MSGDPLSLTDAETIRYLHDKVAFLEAENRTLREEAFVLSERVRAGTQADFLADAAHELRTPLTAIKGYVEVILDGDTGSINDTQEKFLRTVASNADRLSALINRLLEIARLEARRITLDSRLLDSGNLIRTALLEAQTSALRKGLRLEADIAPNLPPINGDKERLERVLNILLDNACTFSRDGGLIRVKAETIDNGRTLALSVQDSGPGVPPDEIPRLFSTFLRPTADGDEHRGTGLSLAMARAIIEMHNGTIAVESREGAGATFRITLPTATPQPEKRPALNRHIALINDDTRFGDLFERIGREEGFTLQPVATLAELDPSQTDLVLVNGAAIRDMALDSLPIPALVVRLAPLELELLAAGASAVLPWPATFDALLTAVGCDTDQPCFDTVLCISADSLALRQIDKVLHEGGCKRVLRATMEHDTLTLARRYEPALIILDARPSGPVAFDTLDTLRAERSTRATPVIALVEPAALSGEPVLGNVSPHVVVIAQPFVRERFMQAFRGLLQ